MEDDRITVVFGFEYERLLCDTDQDSIGEITFTIHNPVKDQNNTSVVVHHHEDANIGYITRLLSIFGHDIISQNECENKFVSSIIANSVVTDLHLESLLGKKKRYIVELDPYNQIYVLVNDISQFTMGASSSPVELDDIQPCGEIMDSETEEPLDWRGIRYIDTRDLTTEQIEKPESVDIEMLFDKVLGEVKLPEIEYDVDISVSEY